MPNYSYTDFKAEVNGMVRGKIDNVVDPRVTLNRAVRFVLGELDLRSTKRKSSLSPNLFNDIYDYSCPSDLKGIALIDVIPQINRSKDSEIKLTTPEQFDRFKSSKNNLAAFYDADFVRKLRLSMEIDDEELVISELDSLLSGGGTWEAYGDAESLIADNDNYVKGNGAIKWGINAAGGTTAGIVNNNLDEFDLTDFLSYGSIFVWVYITSITDLTNFILRVGNSSTVYYSKTITTSNEGTAFVNGWNLLRFDLSSATKVGSVDSETCKYATIFMTKAAGKISESNYAFDWLVAKRGRIHNLIYYTKYGWQTALGVYLENSTVDGDLLNVDTEELELITIKGAEFIAQENKDYDDVKYLNAVYELKKKSYNIKSPSEAKLLQTIYYEL